MSAGAVSQAAGLTHTIYSLYIINKAGGLIYQKDFLALPRLAGNDYLRLLSTFHSLHAIAARGIHITPVQHSTAAAAPAGGGPAPSAAAALPNASVPSSSHTGFPSLSSLTRGLLCVETRDFRLHCYATVTGLKFVLSCGVGVSAGVERLLWSVYALYCDFVLKNAFYELEMPIRCEQFDARLLQLMQAAQQQQQQQQLQQQTSVQQTVQTQPQQQQSMQQLAR
jgi:hypothetical protein